MPDMIRNTLKDQVASQVLMGIINREITTDTVISEKKLAEQLQVSKAPVREALVELCTQGVLCSIPRKGYMLVRYSERSVMEILQYRAVLECGCLEQCFDKITPTQLRRLESVVESEYIFLSKNDVRDFWNNTFNFHLTLASFSDNEYIYNHLNAALGACMRAYQQIFSNGRENTLPMPPKYHLEIVESLKSGDRERAIATLREDILSMNA